MHQIVFAALALALSAHKPKVAVLDVQDVSGDQAAHARVLTQIISGEVARDGKLEVVSAAQIRDMLGFQKQKQMLGCTEGSCLADIGGALGVDYLLSAQLSKIGSHFRLDLNLINQKTARTAAAAGDFLPQEEDALASATVRMVTDVLTQAGLRDAAAAALSTPPPTVSHGVSHTGAYVGYGIAAALLAGASVMTVVTHSTYQSAVRDYAQANPPSESSSGEKLGWMSPLTDSLWAGAVIAAGVGTYLYFSASQAGAGGEVGLGGSF